MDSSRFTPQCGQLSAVGLWGDAYVVDPDGTRAGIVRCMKGPVTEVVFPPEPGRWGVYQFLFRASRSV